MVETPENTIVVRLRKTEDNIPFFNEILFGTSMKDVLSKEESRSEPKSKTKLEENKKSESDPEERPLFEKSFGFFWDGARNYLSGARFIRAALQPFSAILFSMSVQDFGEKYGTKIDDPDTVKQDEAWFYFSDKRFPDFRKLVQDQSSTIGFIDDTPKMLIPALLAFFDAFMSRVIADVLTLRPQIADTIDRQITLGELSKFDDIASARAALIEKEIDQVMRDSHDKHLSWLSKVIGVKLEPEAELKETFFELCERRNVLVHNEGLVNEIYLRNCAKYGIDTGELSSGDEIATDADYFESAVFCVIEMAAKVSQVVWRCVAPNQTERADKVLNNLTYELIEKRRYSLSLKLFEFSRQDIQKWSSETAEFMNIVNHANALRLSKREQEAKSLLEEFDWSAKSLNFQICAAAVRGDFGKCNELLRTYRETIGIDRVDFANWPVFSSLRDDDEFKLVFEEVFGEKLIEEMAEEAAKDPQVN